MIYEKILLTDDFGFDVIIDRDIATIKYQNYILFHDKITEGLNILKKMIVRALNGEIELLSNFKESSIGLWWNEYVSLLDGNEILEEDLSETFWLWSTRYVQTWLYRNNRSIYVEISPSYPWHFIEPKEEEKFITYHKFISYFEPIAVLEISPERAKIIIDECNRLLGSIKS